MQCLVLAVWFYVFSSYSYSASRYSYSYSNASSATVAVRWINRVSIDTIRFKFRFAVNIGFVIDRIANTQYIMDRSAF